MILSSIAIMKPQSLALYKTAFWSYDIRAIAHDVIDQSFAYIFWLAIGRYAKEQYDEKNSKIVIGWDTRIANNDLITYFIAWMEAAGYYNIHVASFDPQSGYMPGKELTYGVCSSSALYYLGRGDFDLWFAVSASHNPSEYVGIKTINKEGAFVAPSFLQELFEREYHNFQGEIPLDVTVEVNESPLLVQKIEQMNQLLDARFKTLTKHSSFVVDYSNAAGVSLEKDFFMEYLSSHGHTIHHLNDEADGSFPHHPADSSKAKYYTQVKETIAKHQLDFGIMFDGDVDRIGVMTNKGRFMQWDITLAIIANQILGSHDALDGMDKKVIYDVMCTRMIAEKTHALWGKAIVNRMGRMYINEAIIKHNAVFGGEISGHYMFGEFGGMEFVLLALYYIMKEAENHQSFDAMLDAYETYHKPEITNVKVHDKELVLDKIADLFADEDVKRIDGVNVFWKDFFVTVRKSNTEPVVRIVAEADTIERYNQIFEKMMNVIADDIIDRE